MIPNCEGCEAELSIAFEYAEEGYHLIQQELTNLGTRKHLLIMMVDDDGNIVIK